jgi:hypothetical protein
MLRTLPPSGRIVSPLWQNFTCKRGKEGAKVGVGRGEGCGVSEKPEKSSIARELKTIFAKGRWIFIIN